MSTLRLLAERTVVKVSLLASWQKPAERTNYQRSFMSKTNGDKAKFHVARKQNIKRRAKGRVLLMSLVGSGSTAAAKKPSGLKAAKEKMAE
jgi:hypothetical protein